MSATNVSPPKRAYSAVASVAGAMVFSYGLGLAATNCLNSFSYGYDRLRFIAPVFIGDTIYTIRENLSKEVKDHRMGKVRVSYSVFKGEGRAGPLLRAPDDRALPRDPDMLLGPIADAALEARSRRG